ncbi:uncharacterized protein LOC132151408 isoform X2 [Carassius carassius]|uniref:uncharacterized protein LOC132151408 isoform X2 n=1 Tax=Carassius carassius TaxID=217509 RepID=UPI0028695181|nr:uncharacterized protein LOC132151408 isoform X2 [Carassius carassius]
MNKFFSFTNPVEKEAALIADPMQPHIRSATVVFQSKKGIIISTARLHEKVLCKNYTNPVVEIAEHKAEVSAVKVSPPQKVDVHGGNVSWSCDSLKPYFQTEFGVQYRSAAQSWKGVEDCIVKTTEPELELPEDYLHLNHQYVIRVRVRYELNELPNAVWSDWSEEYSWTSDVGQAPQTTEILSLDSSKAGIMLSGITITILIILIFTILVKCKRINRVQKKGSTYIPDPSIFFGDLNSSHRGNFKSWLGPVLVHESFIRVDTEFISPVEILKEQDTCDSRSTHRNSGSLQDTWSDVKSSNFSNSTYFLSQSSKGPSDTLEPCSAHSSYGPAGGVSGSKTLPQRIAEEMDGEELEFSLKKLEKLRQDTQSPDSGFAGGAEDSMEETELPSPLCLTLPSLLPQDLPAPQPSRHPLLDPQRPSCTIPGLDLDLQSGRGLIEPSSDDYMPVKNVQS